MAIVSSQTVVGHAQADGRRYVIELHTDHVGGVHSYEYLAAVGADTSVITAARVPAVEEQLASGEFEKQLASGTFSTVHMMAAQLLTRFRVRYLSSSREETARLAYWLVERITAGQITDTQARTAFGKDATQWTTFRTNKLNPQHDQWAGIQAAQGE